jgi:hypothetical protein
MSGHTLSNSPGSKQQLATSRENVNSGQVSKSNHVLPQNMYIVAMTFHLFTLMILIFDKTGQFFQTSMLYFLPLFK